jgi:hypothetical protein
MWPNLIVLTPCAPGGIFDVALDLILRAPKGAIIGTTSIALDALSRSRQRYIEKNL